MEDKLKRILYALVLVLIAVLSVVVVADKAAAPENHEKTIASLDEKAETVLKLSAVSTLASAGVSAIPGDTATPIAEKLADFTEYFLLVLCVLYTEKYLLTIIGAAAFKVLIPMACGAALLAMFKGSKVIKEAAVKLALFAVIISLIVPASVRVSDAIYDTYRTSFDKTISEAESLTGKTDELAGEDNQSVISSIMQKISETASSLSEKAAHVLNGFVEALAVLIVTSCIIPLLVLLFFIRIFKLLTGIEIHLPRSRRHRIAAAAEETTKAIVE